MENPTRDKPQASTPGTDPLSLQQHIRVLQEQRSAGSSGRKGKFWAGGTIMALLVGVGIYLGLHSGLGLGGGAGTVGTGHLQIDSNANLAPSDWTPQRPLRISIDGMQYKVNGHVVDIPAIMKMVPRIPAGPGQAVEIAPEGTSKPLAERALKEAMETAKVPTAWTKMPE